MGTQPHEVVEHARDFGKHHTDVLRANRHIKAHELFNGQAIRMLVAHHGHIVEAVHVGQGLQIGFALGQFFSGPVQQADVRVGTLHHFAIELQDEAQHTVRRWMLRS